MRIEQIDICHVGMPLLYPWRTAYGEDVTIESVLIRMAGDGLEGWGETVALAAPCYSPDFAAGCFLAIRDWMAPLVIGKDITSGDQLQGILSLFKGNPFAKAGLDHAWWAMECARAGKSLSDLLGANRNVVEVGADFGVMDSIDDLLRGIDEAIAQGFPRVKLKFRPGWDTNMLEAVRNRHPTHPFHIDCNSGYTLADLPLFRSLDRFNLAMIEQPLGYDDVLDHARLQSEIATPICLDESINSLSRVRHAIEQKSCQYVNIKPGRVGGLTVAKAIHDTCQKANVPCWVGGMLESAVGASLCVALAMLENFTYPADIFPSSRFYAEDMADPPITLTRSSAGRPAVAAPAALSRPVPARLERCLIQKASLSGRGR